MLEYRIPLQADEKSKEVANIMVAQKGLTFSILFDLEIDEMIERYLTEKGDIFIEHDFNLPIINILWQMVANSR